MYRVLVSLRPLADFFAKRPEKILSSACYIESVLQTGPQTLAAKLGKYDLELTCPDEVWVTTEMSMPGRV